MRVGGDGHVFEDLFFVPDVVAGGDDVGAEVEEFVGDGGREAEAPAAFSPLMTRRSTALRFKDVRKVFADDVAAG